MLSRISGGIDGFADYMRTGQKAGRDKHRDELDERLVLSGDLDQTEALINSMDTEGERYLHITHSFVISHFHPLTFSPFHIFCARQFAKDICNNRRS